MEIEKKILKWLWVLPLALASISASAEKRSRTIDFEDEVVEGVNRKPLDSLNQVSEREKRKRRMHLYRKRSGFRTDTQELLSETRYAQ